MTKPRCNHLVWHNYETRPCEKTAVTAPNEAGTRFCTVHDPVRKAARRRKKEGMWDAQRVVWRYQRAAEDAEKKVFGIAVGTVAGDLDAAVLAYWAATYEAAIFEDSFREVCGVAPKN